MTRRPQALFDGVSEPDAGAVLEVPRQVLLSGGSAKYEVWKFGLAPQEVAGLLRGYGWVEREQVGPAEYLARYLEPAGRAMPVCEIERFVRAAKV